ncbi:DNA-processing protein DprA [Candidatus Nanosyncoccus alces]|uniref:DNA processing protein DprA n=1 Tax=Candidatus Nanosyncoccus alces TaxID=2171997 RepID=A0ABY0FL53_9BACT|nr:DNA-processing protein DprA [Candidatus Nanosyncoccus alces]RYC74490.1 DNA processing protein DprA [Candidatus Nanosyncoccus alces]
MSTLFSHFFTKINQISPLEANFTEVLDSIALKPKTLYFYGKMPENMAEISKSTDQKQNKSRQKSSEKNRTDARAKRPKTVAIVGSRHNTKYGEEVAYKLAYELGKRGVVVVSGLAFGVDSIAHRGCLDANGVTVAILGTPIDHIYPASHKPLAAEIIKKGGAVMSEYAPGANVFTKVSFLERNRLISGLSDIVVVVEAAERSGSLNTATHALEQSKEVFAVPGNINNPYSQGCNKLIKQGAIPYTEPKDILELLFPEDYTKKYKKLCQANLIGDNDVETKILQALASGLRSGEDIMTATSLPPEVFNEATTLLEIKSRIRSLGLNNWSLI